MWVILALLLSLVLDILFFEMKKRSVGYPFLSTKGSDDSECNEGIGTAQRILVDNETANGTDDDDEGHDSEDEQILHWIEETTNGNGEYNDDGNPATKAIPD